MLETFKYYFKQGLCLHDSTPFLSLDFSSSLLRGGSRGRVQGVRTPPSLLKRLKFVHPQSNIQKKNKSIKNAHIYSKILYLSFILMSIFPDAGKTASKVRG